MFRSLATWNHAVQLSALFLGAGSFAAGCNHTPSAPPIGQAQALATAPPRGSAVSFAVLGSSTVTNTGPTIVSGDLGLSPGTAVTGFPPGLVSNGAIHAADAVAMQARDDANTAYVSAAGQPCDVDLSGQDLGGLTLVPGVYCFSSSAQLTGSLVLDGKGDPNAVFIFQVGSALTTATDSSVSVLGGSGCNVYWQVGSSATLGVRTHFVGNILALTSITLTTGATLAGQALAHDGAVTLDSNDVTLAVCTAVPPPVALDGGVVDSGTPDGAIAPVDMAGPAADGAIVPVDMGAPADGGASCAACVDFTSDRNNCGTCGNICSEQASCIAGACIIVCG